MESVPEQILYDILLKLPTRDVVRCRCVCKPWGRVIGDPSFRLVHTNATHAVSGAGVEALLVSQSGPWGIALETTVYSVLSAKQMCRVTDLAEGYRVAGVCNGFIVLASSKKEDPMFVCNPVTREKFEVPDPPVLKSAYGQFFAMGFSVSAQQYKLFRIPLPELWADENYLDVYTIGGDDFWWHRHSDLFQLQGVCMAGSSAVLIDGKLFAVTKHNSTPDKILVIDVASEACRTYCLPDYVAFNTVAMDIFELGGQPCVAMKTNSKLCLWVMPMLQLTQEGQQLESTLPGNWEQRYIFVYHNPSVFYSISDEPSGMCVDDNGILCCLIGDQMYKYNTTKENKGKEECKVGLLAWDHKLWSPSLSSHCKRRLKIYGGYRPTLLSPGDLTTSTMRNSSTPG